MLLAALPLTPNGKVDRRALPRARARRAGAGAAYVAPRDAGRGAAGRRSGPRCSASTGSGVARRLLRPRRPLAPGHAAGLAACASAFGVELPLRARSSGADAGGAGRSASRRRSRRRRAAPRRRSCPRPARGAAAALLRPGAALVPRPARAGQPGLQHPAGAAPARPRSIAGASRARPRRGGRAATRSLRTTFAARGRPAGAGHRAAGGRSALPSIDLAALPAAERARPRRALAAEEARRPFDLAARAARCAPACCASTREEHLLLLTPSTTSSPTAGRWASCCASWRRSTRAFARGRPSPLPALPIQYADYAALAAAAGCRARCSTAQLAYWREQLAGAPPSLELPTDRPRPAVQSFRGGGAPAAPAAPALARRLRALGAARRARRSSCRCSPPSRRCSSRYPGRTTSSSARRSPTATGARLEGLIGFFVNTLVLRADLAGDATLRERCSAGCARRALGAYAHQDLPFERLVEELAPERDLGRTPLFQVLLRAAERARGEPRAAGSATCAAAGVDEPRRQVRSARSTLRGRRGPDRRRARVHRATCSTRATIERLAARTSRRCSPAPSPTPAAARCAELPLLRAAASGSILVASGTTPRAARPADACSTRLFEAQVGATPEAVAVVVRAARALTLPRARRARQPARPPPARPRASGPDGAWSASAVERSLELVVGAARRPQGRRRLRAARSRRYPPERLRFMLDDARRPVAAQARAPSARAALPPAGATARLRSRRGAGSVARRRAAGDRRQRSRSRRQAWPTSSTPRARPAGPRGSVDAHRASSTGCSDAARRSRCGPADAVLQTTPFGFDVSVWEFFWPLLAARAWWSPEPRRPPDPADLAGLIAAERR